MFHVFYQKIISQRYRRRKDFQPTIRNNRPSKKRPDGRHEGFDLLFRADGNPNKILNALDVEIPHQYPFLFQPGIDSFAGQTRFSRKYEIGPGGQNIPAKGLKLFRKEFSALNDFLCDGRIVWCILDGNLADFLGQKIGGGRN